MNRRSTAWLALFAALVLLAGAAMKWLPQPAHAQAQAPSAAGAAAPAGSSPVGAGRPQRVAVQSVRVQDLHVVVQAIGTIQSSQAVTVRSRVDGELKALHFSEGQAVRAGQLLAEIDARPFQHALSQAQAALARNRSLQASARRDLQRYQGLLEKDAIARQQAEAQEAAVEQFEAAVRGDQAQADAAALQLSFTRIVAPISGLAGLRSVDVGNLVRASDSAGLLTLRQVQPAHALFSVPELQVPQIRSQLAKARRLTVEAWDRDQRTRLALGRVVATDNAIDPATGTLRLKAQFDNADERLFANQFVNLRLQLDTVVGAMVVPQSALMRAAQGAYVFVVNDDGTVSIRTVQPGEADGEWVAVHGELKVGQRVVVDGTDRLREGSRVEPVTSTRAPSPSPSATAVGAVQAQAPASGRSAAAATTAPAAGPASVTGAVPRAATASSARAARAPSVADDPLPADGREAYLHKQLKVLADQEADAMAGSTPPEWFKQLPAASREKILSLSPEQRRGWLFKRLLEKARQ